MRVLVTAGTVYGRLDDNKLVGNRVRGIWACKLAGYLASKEHQVTLLLPDTMGKNPDVGDYRPAPGIRAPAIRLLRHDGFDSYRDLCKAEAPRQDVAIMAAAVVNWIPKVPYCGKMPTAGYHVGDMIQVPFILAPRVIEEMTRENPKLTLIGCKMLIGSTEEELVEAAYGVLLKSRCNVVLANDMKHGLKRKLLIYKDRSVHEYDNDFDGLFDALRAVVEDKHYSTTYDEREGMLYLADCWNAKSTFDRLVKKHRSRFLPFEGDRVFGAVAIPTTISGGRVGWLVSPREKGAMFTAEDSTLVTGWDIRCHTVMVPSNWNKPTLNAVLLCRFAQQFHHLAVLHFHEQVPGLPTVPYAPPGTVRDNLRPLTEDLRNGFNIEGHGCIVPAKWFEED